MALAEHARIAVKVKSLPTQVACGFRKRAKREIGLAGFEPVFELSRVKRYGAHTNIRRDRRQPRDQRRKEMDHSDVGQEQVEPPIRSGRIEFARRRPKAVSGGEKDAQPIGDIERFRRRLHGLAIADKQWIGKLRAQAPKHFADRRLGHFHHLSRAGDAALLQQRMENPQFAQAQLGSMPLCPYPSFHL